MTDEARARDRFQLARRVFLRVRPLEDVHRERAIEAECDGDALLREEVEVLLRDADTETDQLVPDLDLTALYGEVEEQLSSLGTSSGDRLRSGQRLADRYVLGECVGKGGMGEVWRAEDRVLGETVALKFVGGTAGRPADREWIDRLIGEVSAARRVTHSNVCRVHDVGLANGEYFISMEFVGGGDLSDRLKSVGRLDAKASKLMAREVTSALAAIHRVGLLHRDLKPANILLDAEGRASLSDFGLAISPVGIDGVESRSGTQAYMAPEVLRGGLPSVASDIYALGLVLYEAVTNHRAFRSGDEVMRYANRGELPVAPSILRPGVDPIVDRVIRRCLASNPDDRPESAEFILAVLECRDALDAVMALGDAPSADIIASASAQGLLGQRGARVALVVILGLLSSLVALAHWAQIGSPLPSSSPEVVAARAHRMLEQLDGSDWQVNSRRFAFGLGEDVSALVMGLSGSDALSWGLAESEGDSGGRSFWLREGASVLSPLQWSTVLFGGGRVTLTDPPGSSPDLRTLVLGPDERLLLFRSTTADPGAPGWPSQGPVISLDPAAIPACASAFQLAGLDSGGFREVRSILSGGGSHRRVAWLSAAGGATRVEAEFAGTKLRAFQVLRRQNDGALPSGERGGDQAAGQFGFLLVVLLLAVALPLAIRNFRSGRGDYTGSVRLAAGCGVLVSGSWCLVADYPSDSVAASLLYPLCGVMLGLGAGACVWLFYMAVEPLVQREWPRVLVASGRLLRGGIRDPLVRSHILLGLCLGVLALVFVVAVRSVFGVPVTPVEDGMILSGSSLRAWVVAALDAPTGILVVALEILAATTFLGVLCRKRVVAVAVCWLLVAGLLVLGAETPLGMVNSVVGASLALWVLLRFGLLAFVVMAFTFTLFDALPVAGSLVDWYSGGSAFAMAGVVVFAFASGRGLVGYGRDREAAVAAQ